MNDRKTFGIVKEVKEIDKAIAEFKDVQFSGSSNIISYIIQTENTWDVDFVTTVPSHFVYVTFRADEQTAPLASISARMLINGSEVNNTGNIFIPELEDIYDVPPQGFMQANWRVNMSAALGTHIQIKFKVKATDRGELTISSVEP